MVIAAVANKRHHLSKQLRALEESEKKSEN
jgi:hypothetical protein